MILTGGRSGIFVGRMIHANMGKGRNKMMDGLMITGSVLMGKGRDDDAKKTEMLFRVS